MKANSVFLFSKPGVGDRFGYTHDGWHSDGTFHYTGDGQVGDQLPDVGGNRALLRATEQGRAVRLFQSEGTNTTYIGVFTLTDPPYFPDDSLGRDGIPRSVLVFRLIPLGSVYQEAAEEIAPDLTAPQQIPLEVNNVDAYVAARPDEPAEAVRREARLVKAYAEWLESQGHEAVRHRIPLPTGRSLLTDVFNATTEDLIEAKSSAARLYVRLGLGQILDYSRFLPHKSRALLFPSKPASDMTALLLDHSVSVVWQDGKIFKRIDPTT